MKTHLLTIVPILAFFLTTLSAQAAPPFVTYAGQVASGGQPFNGTGQFKFAFVNADANLTYWSQDGTSSAGSQPTWHVSAPVNGGYYSILLGNTAITGMGAIDPTIFKTHSDVHMRVWFSDGVAAFQEMTPHRPFASVPYALNAGVSPGSIDSSKLDATIISYLKPEVFLPNSVSVRTLLGEERVTLNSEATGKYLSYQWKKNGSVLPGETNSMLVIADANATHDGNYSVVVSNAFGSVESPSYQLASTSNSPPTNLNATALLTIAENQPIGTVVGEFNATDPDAGASLTYHLVSGAGATDNGLFTLEANGTIKTATSFDFETNASTYTIRVQAKDEFNASVEGNFTVTLTDVYEAPPNTVPSNLNATAPLTIAENQPIGTVVGEFNATDPDAGASLTYRLVSGAGAANNSLFTLETNGTLKTATTFDYETNASTYTIRVQAKDEFNATVEGNFTVTLTDVYEAPPNTVPSNLNATAPLTIAENQPIGTVVGEFNATDADAGATLSFHLVSGDGAVNNSLFTLETNGTLKTATTFDYETNASTYTIRVQAKDEFNATVEGNFTVTLTDVYEAPPNTVPSNLNSTAPLTIAENQAIGTVIGEFNATDPDAGASLTYHLVSGAGDGNNSLFTLETNGTLKTATTFDYETNASTYSIRVQAKDEFNATVEGNFTVTLTDVFEASQPPHTVQSAANLEMLWVEPGTFTMGSPLGEAGRDTDEREHNVTLTKGFYLGKYEVTQAQYEAVMTGNTNSLSATPSQWPGNPNRPVEQVSWEDAQVFLARLNNAEQTAGRLPAGWSYVLPTESQWEYACRAGTTTAYSWGSEVNSTYANYGQNIGNTVDIGQYAPNPWGFFDMHGNVFEWTADRYGPYPTGNPVIDPPGAASGSTRVERGGSWFLFGPALRSAKRYHAPPSNQGGHLGFRVGFQQQ